MFENIKKIFKKLNKKEEKLINHSKEAAKERLHLVLMQDRANVSADFLELMKQEIIEVIKKYIEIDESAIDVRLTNKENEDGTNGAPALYANIPIVHIKNEKRKENVENAVEKPKEQEIEKKEENKPVEEEKVEKEKIDHKKEKKEEVVIVDKGDEKEEKPEEIQKKTEELNPKN